ncbi:hypothetical protein SAY87_020873 [Trapa incisa]|uniref:Nucleoside phosphorylase domain-containing protein n=1 Tax=Trapa incisa TaxID=236973 RepID=A0AAN7PUY4_9MYRT|nr:hypothetical protein SAY87_020873 [Trapa incisa]
MAAGDGGGVYVLDGAHGRPISSVVIIVAVRSQALPLVKRFQLTEDATLLAEGIPCVRYYGIYKDLCINVLWLGQDLAHGVDSIGTVSASLATFASIQVLKPDLIVNVGTAGGLKSKGAGIGEVFLASHVAFHDRRNPLPVRDLYCIGTRQAFSTINLLRELNLKAGKLSTGNSLDICPQDEKLITANDAAVKDMEGAAIAYVADLLKIPAIFIKAVSYIVDGKKLDAESHLQNLTGVSSMLDEAVVGAIEFINGKRLSEL